MANKIHDLVKRLIERTDQGSLNWETSSSNGVYQASFPDLTVRVSKPDAFQYGAANYYVLSLHNEHGEMIDQITDDVLKNSGFDNAHHQMEHLYTEARRKAMGVDIAIDKILGELGD